MVKRVFLLLAFFCAFSSVCWAARVSGTVYDLELVPVPKVVVEAVSLPSFSKAGQATSQNGSYSLELSPGNYSISARYYFNSSSFLETGENVSVPAAGASLDLVFFEADGFFVPPATLPVELEEIPAVSEEDISAATAPEEKSDYLAFAGLAIILVIAAYAVWAKNAKAKQPRFLEETPPFSEPGSAGEAISSEEEQYSEAANVPAAEPSHAGHGHFPIRLEGGAKKPSGQLSRDEKRLLEVIRKLGGRVAQREIRKNIDWSEAAVSMTLSDLEDKGAIRKIKKGRGNVIRLA